MGILGSSSKVKSESTLSTSQRKLLDQTAGVVSSGLSTGATPYTGQLTADTPDYLQKAFDLASNIFSADSFKSIQSMLTGQVSGTPAYVYDPAGITKEWQENFANPALEMYKSNILPLVKEQYNIPGMGNSTLAARGVSENFSNYYGQSVLPTLYNNLQSGRQMAFESGEAAAGRQQSAANMLANLPNLAVSGSAQAAEVQVNNQQRSLDAMYKEFLRTSAENNPWLNVASGLSTASTIENVGMQGWSALSDIVKGATAVASM